MSRELWRRSVVASDGTHHLVDGVPLYNQRFVQVTSFHEPGLAAAHDEQAAWHIDSDCNPPYPHRFIKAYGFYEHLAAVQDASGVFHIHPDGIPAYSERFHWCGNFQGGHAAVCMDREYFHIRPNGSPLCRQGFLYVGDFKEQRAVARMPNGLCIHIDVDGELAHPHRYLNLDVYHKGFACAQDEKGWVHIDLQGAPAYEWRFASLEPFYNGRALAMTLDGRTVTIAENGEEVALIAAPLDQK